MEIFSSATYDTPLHDCLNAYVSVRRASTCIAGLLMLHCHGCRSAMMALNAIISHLLMLTLMRG
uniref:Uncharacterized protein n=1 Tax=Anguilla anguilla TaxID=7936 RepID=A0A0E9QJ94_ANGAN